MIDFNIKIVNPEKNPTKLSIILMLLFVEQIGQDFSIFSYKQLTE